MTNDFSPFFARHVPFSYTLALFLRSEVTVYRLGPER